MTEHAKQTWKLVVRCMRKNPGITGWREWREDFRNFLASREWWVRTNKFHAGGYNPRLSPERNAARFIDG